MSNTLIFGGEGFIGRHLAAQLLATGGAPISADLAESDRPEGAARRFIQADVRRPLGTTDDGLSTTIESQGAPPVLFNYAAVHRTPGHPSHEYFETNIRGAENVCRYARERGVRTIVFTSSIAPYGASEDQKTEETLPTPNTPYGISKLVAEHIHRTWQAEKPDERRLVIVRPGVVFGRGENGNVTRLYSALKKGKFAYPGRTDTIKASIYVKDVARLLAEMGSKSEPGVFLYNFTYEPAPTIEQICAAMHEATGVPKAKWVVPGWALRGVAMALGPVHGLLGEGFHPDRVRKLMISTNISGRKLAADGYQLKFPLKEALADWWKDCEGQGLR